MPQHPIDKYGIPGVSTFEYTKIIGREKHRIWDKYHN